MDKDSVVRTTTSSPDTEAQAFIGGFVAAEGCFTRQAKSRDFRFTIGLGAEDQPLLEWIQMILGVGRVNRFPRRKAHYDDEATLTVASRQQLLEVIIPFMDRWLPPSSKRQQYLAWRDALFKA